MIAVDHPGCQRAHSIARSTSTAAAAAPVQARASDFGWAAVVTVEAVEVLVIGVARAPALVPCPEEGELRYYLRVGDSTLSIPPYLISDLVLGRRVHPQLLVTIRKDGSGAVNGSAIHFGFDVENEGMVPANDVIVGVVSFALRPRGVADGRIATSPICSYIDLAQTSCRRQW
jgi:hypothetical protein